jgi:hypothetical protein
LTHPCVEMGASAFGRHRNLQEHLHDVNPPFLGR